MSSDETPNVPTPRNSREAVREKAQQVHAKQSRARIMRRIIVAAVAVVAVGAIGTAVTMAVTSTVSKPIMKPEGLEGDGIIVQGITESDAAAVPVTPAPSESASGTETPEPAPEPEEPAAAVDVHIYVDYLSPGAGQFERANTRQLAGWIDEDAVTVTYHPVAMLTASSNGTKYSLRAAAAAACVATHSPEQFYAFNHELLVDQPEVDTSGRTDVELADLAVAVGVDTPKVVRACIEDEDYLTWAKEATSRALAGPLDGSDDLVLTSAPMIVVNGQAYVGALDDPAEFSQFVLTVAAETDATPTPTPTPTTTPTPTATETPAS